MVTRNEIDACQLHHWYPLLRRHSIKTVSIPCTREFVEYLHRDGLVLPRGVAPPEAVHNGYSSEEEFDHDESVCEPTERDEFRDMVESITGAIELLGGSVFPKLNWSSPQDATWIVCNGTLQCTTVAEVLLLLKASDFIAHDLSHAYDQCSENQHASPDVVLNLRQWSNLQPSMEFRCFIADGVMIAISQRNCGHFFQHLAEEHTQERILDSICSFFREHVQSIFELSSFIMDVYLDRSDRVWIVDMNPFSDTSLPLLFSWDELREYALTSTAISPLLRVIESPVAVQPRHDLIHRLPTDIVDLSTAEGIASFAADARQGVFDTYGAI